MTIDRAEAPIGLPSGVLRIPPYHCCGPAFQLHPLRWTDKILCRFFGAPATLYAALGSSLITLISIVQALGNYVGIGVVRWSCLPARLDGALPRE